MDKRVFDVFFASIGIIFLFPLFIVIGVIVLFSSRGPVFFIQERVGRDNKNFYLLKFRTMYVEEIKGPLLTEGVHDPRITTAGFWLRKYKLDEFPQLINVLIGDMSIVGPRPEVRKYVSMYNTTQQRVLSVKPGITDWASIQFCNESQLLTSADDPEQFYIKYIMPVKLDRHLEYVDHHNVLIDLQIIVATIRAIFFYGRHRTLN